MSRKKRKTQKRQIIPDIKYNNLLISRFINKLVWAGKKSLATKIFYQALEEAAQKLKVPPQQVFDRAMQNVAPLMEVRPRRVGGATFQVPMRVEEPRQHSLAISWIIGAAREKKGKAMVQKLAEEFIAAYNNQGAAVKKKEATHKMAEANRAFAHYRW